MRLYCRPSRGDVHEFDEVEFSQFFLHLPEGLKDDYIMSCLCPACFLKLHPELTPPMVEGGVSAP